MTVTREERCSTCTTKHAGAPRHERNFENNLQKKPLEKMAIPMHTYPPMTRMTINPDDKDSSVPCECVRGVHFALAYMQ